MNVFNKLIVASIPLVPRPIVRQFAGRYIAGEYLPDAVATVRQLNSQGCLATLDVLGEAITERHEAETNRDTIITVLKTIEREKLDSNVSLKPTQIGLALDKQFALDNARKILETAKALDNFVRLDMEDSPYTDSTLWLYRELQKTFGNTGIVLQAYLHRTADDARALMKDGLNNFRLCKGIYNESETIAYKQKEEINRNYLGILDEMLRSRAYVGIATHDSALIEGAYRLLERGKLQKHEYEFQMLLGVRPDLRNRIVRDGHRIRIYVPYGEKWYQYSVRRFRENPQIAGYVFKALFKHSNGAH